MLTLPGRGTDLPSQNPSWRSCCAESGKGVWGLDQFSEGKQARDGMDARGLLSSKLRGGRVVGMSFANIVFRPAARHEVSLDPNTLLAAAPRGNRGKSGLTAAVARCQKWLCRGLRPGGKSCSDCSLTRTSSFAHL